MSPTQAHHMLNRLLAAGPFRPFLVRMADQQYYEVTDARRMALPAHPSAGTCALYPGEDGALEILALDLITSIEVPR